MKEAKLSIVLLCSIPAWVASFLNAATPFRLVNNHQQEQRTPFALSSSVDETDHEEQQQRWLTSGFLFSSFSDGLKPNAKAQDLLMQGLVRTLWRDHIARIEQQVESSALASPCCGPTDMESLTKLLDSSNKGFSTKSWKSSLESLIQEHQGQLELRFLYIPTAMYALRKDSENTPGKQRQRARADGKKRRNEIVSLLQEKLGEKVDVLAITLDFDDDSIKQSEGSDDPSKFPKTGKESLKEWRPNLVYIQGGNTFWLYHCMEKGKWKQLLVDTITGSDGAVYCGTSAGAIVSGSSMETASWKGWDDPTVVPDRPTYEDWIGVKGLSLAGDVSIFPHMDDKWISLTEEKKAKLEGSRVYCLRDEESLYVCGEDQSVELLTCKSGSFVTSS